MTRPTPTCWIYCSRRYEEFPRVDLTRLGKPAITRVPSASKLLISTSWPLMPPWPTIPGPTGSPALKWFLPSYTDWLYTFTVLGFGDQEAAINRQRNYNWYGHLADLAFTQAGGTGISDKWYWVSSEITQYEGGLIFVNPTDLFWHSAEKNGNAFVHPFVKY